MVVDTYAVQDQLFDLIDGARARGVLHMRLWDGTEFTLDPSHNSRDAAPEQPGAPPQFTRKPESLPYIGAGDTLDRNDSVAAELDHVLFGKPLDAPDRR